MSARKTRWFVVYDAKDPDGLFRHAGEVWDCYTTREHAEKRFKELRGRTYYRCLSYGMGTIIAEIGRPRVVQ